MREVVCRSRGLAATPLALALARAVAPLLTATGLVVCLLAADVMAQTTIDSEVIRRRTQQQAEERERQRQAPDVRLPRPAVAADPEASDLPTETPCFPIDTFRVDGERTEDFPWIQPHLKRYAGRCIGRAGINLIVQRISAGLVERGYITTRIGFIEQNLVSGVFVLQLVPGVLRAIRYATDATDTPAAIFSAGSVRSAFPLRPGDLIRLRDIEQGLEQMKRIPSQEVDFKIEPAETPGESDIVVTVKRRRPWRFGISVDDSGSQATGRNQQSLTLSVDNLLGLNDLLSLSANGDAENDATRRGTRGQSVQYSIPWGYWTLSLSESENSYHQRVQGNNQTFVSSGTSASQDVKLQRLISRNPSGKTTVQLRASRRASRSFIDDTEVLVQRITTGTIELSLTHQHFIDKAQLTVTVAHKEGVPLFGGRSDAAGQVAGAATYLYRVETLDIAAQVPFQPGPLPLRWNAAFRGQTSRNTLYATEQISLGGRYTVRGYNGETTLAAERGGYVRSELELPLAESGQAAYLAVDAGYVAGPSAQALVGTSLTGAAIGLRGSVHGLSYDAFTGRPLRYPGGFPVVGTTTGFNLSYQF